MGSDNTDVQRFDRDGIWIKPAGAVSVDITLKGGDGAVGVRAIPAKAVTFAGAGGGSVTAESHGVCMASTGGGGGTGGGVVTEVGPQVSEHGWVGSGPEGETAMISFAASELPDEIPIRAVNGGGQAGGGYALIVTRFA